MLERRVYSPEFYCIDTEGARLALAPFLLNQRPIVHDPITGDTQEDQEAAEAARADVQRRERRKVLTLNKLGAAAEEVRRRFVKELLQRTTAPKGSAVFAKCLAWSPNLPVDYKGLQIVNDMLGLHGDTLKQAVGDLGDGSDPRAQVILLGMTVAALEARTTKEAWRGCRGLGDLGLQHIVVITRGRAWTDKELDALAGAAERLAAS